MSRCRRDRRVSMGDEDTSVCKTSNQHCSVAYGLCAFSQIVASQLRFAWTDIRCCRIHMGSGASLHSNSHKLVHALTEMMGQITTAIGGIGRSVGERCPQVVSQNEGTCFQSGSHTVFTDDARVHGHRSGYTRA